MLMLRHDLLRDRFQGLQMRRCIAIAKGVVGDEIEAALEKRAEIREVGHPGTMER